MKRIIMVMRKFRISRSFECLFEKPPGWTAMLKWKQFATITPSNRNPSYYSLCKRYSTFTQVSKTTHWSSSLVMTSLFPVRKKVRNLYLNLENVVNVEKKAWKTVALFCFIPGSPTGLATFCSQLYPRSPATLHPLPYLLSASAGIHWQTFE